MPSPSASASQLAPQKATSVPSSMPSPSVSALSGSVLYMLSSSLSVNPSPSVISEPSGVSYFSVEKALVARGIHKQ